MGDAGVFVEPMPGGGAVGRRSPLMVGGGLIFALVAMFAGAMLVNARGQQRAVIVSAQSISAGSIIRRDMLRVEYLPADHTLRAMSDAELLVGTTARQEIGEGVLLAEEHIAPALAAPEGFVLLAVTLEPGELPLPSLAYGARVSVIRTPVSSSADDTGGEVTVASVWSMWSSTSGSGGSGGSVTSGARRVVTLAVRSEDAVAVTQAAARREVRLVALGGEPVWTSGPGAAG